MEVTPGLSGCSAGVIFLPPVHAPLAVHEVTLVVDHIKVVVLPNAIEVGVADKVTVGVCAGGACTFTLTDALALPPAPLQVRVYIVVACNVPVPVVPDKFIAPDQAPEAMQLVASVLDHVNVDVPR